MKERKLVVLAGSEETRKTLVAQLSEFIGTFVQIESYAVDEGIGRVIQDRVVLLSSYLIEEEVAAFIGKGCHLITAKRIVNFHNIDQLFTVSKGTEALYVNDFPETVNEAIESLKNLGIDHIKLYPYFPGKKMVKDVSLAITPGEMELVPDSIKEVINIGPRLIDMTTIITVLDKLGLLEEKQEEVSTRYIQTIIQLSRRLAVATSEANQVSEHLKKVVDGVHDGILAVDRKGKITVFNGILEKLLGFEGKRVIGKNITDVISNKDLVTFIMAEDEKEANCYFTVEYADVIVHRFSMEADGTIVATFKNAVETIEMERKLRRELVKRGHYAKYTFDDIIGQNKQLLETKEIAEKLAKTQLTILIQGESGTGKELFASSIHHASNRHNGPFLAVNFSALPEELVESELFGYEEGAFTGAKKGGRKGLFEQANGGTLFLDEIGDISLKVQARLLRVLQEKELLRIGGSEIIPVDVRVVAATNRNLLELIEKGEFREDLYHRLKVLFIQLPELRKRKDDMEALIRYFMHQSGRMDVKIEAEVLDQLKRYHWYGNIRELKNTIDYMLAVCEDHVIRIKDIPNESFFQSKRFGTNERGEKQHAYSKYPDTGSSIEEKELVTVLQFIREIEQKGLAISRQRISEFSRNSSLPLSEQQVRYRMDLLQERGFVEKSRGRLGSKMTEKGRGFLETVYTGK
ncbi:sigma 54-interacting transcriptional regulator [Bacillus sp. H-16]|uniref:sigma 54-interacting transcriptional regulator n=1 Tax=Alteribacter salitolerans TaxID=2912333 RepID=UPI001965BE53|nr:sigma 54-interacting transcriptional regulator [Alteribacter salitolerans]MBM7097640.1 sigma 54-interacting transcriptional regulator [Alteribacter salitolerans]